MVSYADNANEDVWKAYGEHRVRTAMLQKDPISRVLRTGFTIYGVAGGVGKSANGVTATLVGSGCQGNMPACQAS